MTREAETCEACRRNVVEVVVADDDPEQPYRVCTACAQRLDQRALRPLEWFNLAALHGPTQYMLHDDFYWDNGQAGQPDGEVEEPERYPAPILEQAANDRERLLDYAMTLYWLDATTIDALRRHDKTALLASLQRRVLACPNRDIETCAYDICAEVLGPVAQVWIRERWATWNPTSFSSLTAATAMCLPLEEGFKRVTEVFEDAEAFARLKQGDSIGLSTEGQVFARFHSSKTLDWIETYAGLTNRESWGRTAAQSQFSWPRAVHWLQRGRPLSHIALYALLACRYHDIPSPTENAPLLEEAPSVAEMLAYLTTYDQADPVVRGRKLVERLRERMTGTNVEKK